MEFIELKYGQGALGKLTSHDKNYRNLGVGTR